VLHPVYRKPAGEGKGARRVRGRGAVLQDAGDQECAQSC